MRLVARVLKCNRLRLLRQAGRKLSWGWSCQMRSTATNGHCNTLNRDKLFKQHCHGVDDRSPKFLTFFLKQWNDFTGANGKRQAHCHAHWPEKNPSAKLYKNLNSEIKKDLQNTRFLPFERFCIFGKSCLWQKKLPLIIKTWCFLFKVRQFKARFATIAQHYHARFADGIFEKYRISTSNLAKSTQ